MANIPNLELVSFDVCPYVQRSVITLKHKKVDFKLTFIDLEKPPEWFNEISPLGKVPVLQVRANAAAKPEILFESAVINEYIDEITPPAVTAPDPLARAKERAWIAVSGELLGSLFAAMLAHEKDEVQGSITEMWDVLSHVESAHSGSKFFSARGFSLVDSSFAPFFMRLLMVKSLRADDHWKKLPKTLAWAKMLLELPEVRESVIPNFKERFVEMLKGHESPMVGEIG